MRLFLEKYGYYFFRAAVGSLFIYYGILLVLKPQVIQQVWISGKTLALIGGFLPVATFLVILGVIEVLIGLSIISGIFMRIGLLLGGFIFFIVIFNHATLKGFNDIVFRDLIIFSGIIYLLLI